MERIAPGPGQESVWDYPRPPRLERVPERLRIVLGGETVADTTGGYRVLETSHPPVYYLPPADFLDGALEPAPGRSFCEFKGIAAYWDVVAGGRRAERAAWSYPDPTPAFAQIRDFVAVYASRMDACFVGDERVDAQEGDFYGGWITSRVVGPFKGAPGTLGW
ncbi:MAG: DUF427 domain-containing protein [Alphaproteobacteria bacterium]|nr:DUF427 domain-containing protein [Alphaproteobacteria bacterium]